MSDLISRQAAIDVLDVGAELMRRVLDETYIVGVEREKYKWGLGLIESCISDMKELPSAQPEIIRCKDFKNWETSWQNDYAPNYHYCPMVDGIRRDDFYCADAERRTDE